MLSDETKMVIKIYDRNDYYKIKYTKSIQPDQCLTKTNKTYETIAPAQTENTIKVLKSDLIAKGWTIESPEFQDYLFKGLKFLIGFDFDCTLSNQHTWEKGDNVDISNLKGGEMCKEVLSTGAAQGNMIFFISSNNFAETIDKHLEAWNISQFFRYTMGRSSFHGSGGNKDVTFRQVYDMEIGKGSVVEGYLDLNAPEKIIDVIGAVLIDDDERINKFQKFGIDTIKVDPQPDDQAHLDEFRARYLQMKPEIYILKRIITDSVTPISMFTANVSTPHTPLEVLTADQPICKLNFNG